MFEVAGLGLCNNINHEKDIGFLCGLKAGAVTVWEERADLGLSDGPIVM